MIIDARELIKKSEYDFLRTNKSIQNIILLTFGGSYAYGMNKEGSDVDLRGIALNSSEDILLGKDFNQVVDVSTDTTIYSFNKILQLLISCNPNTIEMLGCKPEHYVIKTCIGDQLIRNRKLFLSKICIHTFGGYANSQLRRLQNKAARLVDQTLREKHILNSIKNAKYDFIHRYHPLHENDYVNLYVAPSNRPDYDSEIFMDIHFENYPLRDWSGMWNEMQNIVSSYNKIGKRNEKAITHDKLGKHMAHLLRLYMMCIDILEKEEIITYRENEHDLLMDVRNGEYLDNNRQPISEFYELLDEYEKRFEYASKNTSLSDVPNYKDIEDFKMYINRLIVNGDIEKGYIS